MNNKKEIFSELRDLIYSEIKRVKISTLTNINIIDQLKYLKIIELDDFENIKLFTNYDHFLIFKNKDEYYFCDTELVPFFGAQSIIKLEDYNKYFRRDKINKINEKYKK